MGIALSLLASVLILIVQADEAMHVMSVLQFGFVTPSDVILEVLVPIAWAVLILIGAITLYIAPRKHSVAGVIISAFSILTLSLWANGFIVGHYVWGRDISLFDLLSFASILGIVGGVFGVQWRSESTTTDVKKMGADPSLVGLMSTILAFNSLALPWWVFSEYGMGQIRLFPWRVETSTYLWIEMGGYGLAIYAALAFIVISGVLGLVGSLAAWERRRMLFLCSGIFSLLSIVVFAGGVESFLASVDHIHAFYIFGLRLAYLSSGFWIALVASILAFVASFRHFLVQSQTPSS